MRRFERQGNTSVCPQTSPSLTHPFRDILLTSTHNIMRSFEITYMLKNSSNCSMQRVVIQATDPYMAKRIFEQQNPGCKIVSAPREIR